MTTIPSFSVAYLHLLLSVIADAYGGVLMRQLALDDTCTPTFASGAEMLMGGCFALFHSLIVEECDPVPVDDWFDYLQCALFLLIFSNLICCNLHGYLLKRYTATFKSFASFLAPVFTALFSWVFIGEIITLHFFLALTVVFIRLVLFNTPQLQAQEVDSV